MLTRSNTLRSDVCSIDMLSYLWYSEFVRKTSSPYGKAVNTCQKGAFLALDTGQEAFAYKFTNLYLWTSVLCMVRRLSDEQRRMLVAIDSVVDYVARVALKEKSLEGYESYEKK